jgi:hypothetical protein
MRRLGLLAVTAITLLIVPSSARAQACLGSVSFATVPVRLGGGMVFGKDYTGYAASLNAGRDNAAFGALGVSRVYFDDLDDTGDDIFAEFGYQRPVGSRAQLCPVVGIAVGTGPADAGIENSRFASAGLALGVTMRPTSSIKVIPNGSLRFEYASSDFLNELGDEDTASDNSGVADLGLGLIFFRDRLAIQPTVQFPLGSENSDVSYGLIISIGFAVKR